MSGVNNFYDFKESMRENDIVCISESWHIETEKLRLPPKQNIIDSVATKKAERGRANGGLIIMYDEKFYKNVKTLFKNEDYIFVKIPINDSFIIVGLVYISPLKEIAPILNEKEEIISVIHNKYGNSRLVIGGDFNARVAEEGDIDPDRMESESFYSAKRSSLDTKIYKRGRTFLEFCERNDLHITNGRFPGDSPGNFTFIGSQGCSVIDLVLCNFLTLEYVIDFKVLDDVTKSSHLVVSLEIKHYNNKLNIIEKGIKWKEKFSEDFCEGMLNSPNVGLVNLDINTMAINLNDTIINVAKQVKMYTGEVKFNKKNPWFDMECYNLKKIVNRALLNAKKNHITELELSELNKLKN